MDVLPVLLQTIETGEYWITENNDWEEPVSVYVRGYQLTRIPESSVGFLLIYYVQVLVTRQKWQEVNKRTTILSENSWSFVEIKYEVS